ncbi:D-xylose ABC transporter ATP-binding protein [Bacillus sp. AFS076308]|uniref:sugar ABC transporter ATP-binding protein n=1 Tax=unclassified Bacillus (in: firmicutes) TaxID=185979 RepID=UPI000BF804DF|nr:MULTISPECIES: sugar ABC transporter ATP-binding protein [unclassified Bacillus (in: firmicutes)]PFN99575.1 D-xylose ABC transporter ATP-binding protein [Bacillus sp. AFS076308]PGV50253.1 D-xylose ABC transporter ATP-binding protein [Bacillus sp. AFS037270]
MLLKLNHISKSFFDNKVLNNMSLELKAGEIHALIGGNGAGKSTLINIASGVFKPDCGVIEVNDKKFHFDCPQSAQRKGISVIHQIPNLVQGMSVAENIFLGNQPKKFKFFVNHRKMKIEAKRILDELGVSINPKEKVSNIPVRQHYLISIAKAIVQKSKILFMDEPTANLTEQERENLFRIIKKYKDQGVGIVFITHRLNEIHEICDKVTIIRDGKHVATHRVKDITLKEMTNLMLGYNLKHYYPPMITTTGKELLRVEHVTQKPYVEDVNLILHEGEIIGIAGLAGSGKTELAKVIFGQSKKDSGSIYWKNNEVNFKHPIHAVHNRFGYVNDDRLTSGLFMNMSVANNMTIASLETQNILKLVNRNIEADQTLEKVIDLNIKVDHIDQNIQYLSGGNQQKVMLGRWLITESDLYILDEPTTGMDIGSRTEIYLKIHELAQEGKGVIVISSDTTELLGLCNRILVMYRGRIVANLKNDNITEEDIIHHMNGVSPCVKTSS